jgi:hypothetical protein
VNPEEFLETFPDAERNENCLEDIACHACGNRTRFRIATHTYFDMLDEGDHGDIEYDWGSPCTCSNCYRDGKLGDFLIKGLDAAIYALRGDEP